MKTRKKKISKVLLSLLMAAIMAAEPAAGSVVSYAAEQDTIFMENGSEQFEEEQDPSDEIGDELDNVDENNPDESGNDQGDSDETGDTQDGEDESGDVQDGTGEDGSDEGGDVQDGTDENGSDENDDVQGDAEDEESEENTSDEEEEADSDEEADIEDSEEETIEDEDNWQGTGHKAPQLEMQLTSAMVAEKNALVGTAERLGFLKENVEYSANQAVFVADSKNYAETVAEGYGAILDSYEDGVAVMAFADDVADIIAMAEDEKVKLPAVYPNYIYTTFEDEVIMYSDADLTDEESLTAASGSPDPSLSTQYYHDEIKSKAAWEYNPAAGSGIKVAVIDSGINKNHEDLKGRVASASTTANQPYNKAEDNDGHGTHVSGIIAANKDNGVGGAGIAYKASIVSIKALEENPLRGTASASTTAEIYKAVNVAAKSGARVINMSLGGYVYDPLYEAAVEGAIDKGIVVVAAAGNEKTELSTDINSGRYCSPACFSGVITVSAKQQGSATKADFSNYGNGIIDITAPGTGIYSTVPNDLYGVKYGSMNGTSQATPMVAAAAAYILSVSPDLKNSKTRATVETVKKILQDSATKSGFTSTTNFGAGLLNVEAAIRMAAPKAEDKGGTGELTAPEVKIGTTVVKANDTIQDTDSIALSATVGGASSSEIKIYYTLDGKAPTEKSTLYTGPFSVEASGNKTIKAIAVYYGKKSKVTSVKVKVNAFVRSFTVSSKSNSTYLGAGKSLNLAADNFAPSYATNKKVDWTITEGGDFATINASGKLTAKDVSQPTVIKVRATAKDRTDGTPASADISITLLPKVEALTLTAPSASAPYELDFNDNKTVQMTVGIEPAAAQAGIAYSSSNDKIATVNGSGLVTAVGSGTATITAKTTDGSNKKVTLKVKVNKKVQSVTVTSKTGEYQVAAGKSLQMVADVTSDATNKKVNWEIVGGDVATINASGKLTAKSVTTVSTVQVKATAADNSGKSDTKTVTIYPVVIKKVAFEEKTSGTLATTAIGTLKTSVQLHPYTAENNTDGAGLFGRVMNSGATGLGNFTYTSSNTKVATVSSTGLVQVNADGKTGTAKIKAVAKDGSGKSAIYTVKVIKPVTSILIYPKNGVRVVGKGKTLTLGASLNSGASTKKLEWTSSNTNIATVDKNNGKVKGINYNENGSDASVTITAKATDGSGVSASYTIKVRPLITKLAYATNYGYKTSVYDYYPIRTRDYLDYWKPYYFDQTSGNSYRTYVSGGTRYAYWDGWEGTTYTCSNSNVIQVVRDEDGYLEIVSVNKGTAVLTFKALDGSGKSAKIKIIVQDK